MALALLVQGVGRAPCAGKEMFCASNHRPPFACVFARNDPTRIGYHDLADFKNKRRYRDAPVPIVNGGPNPPLNGDALFSGMENALTSACQAAPEPGQGQAAAFRSLA